MIDNKFLKPSILYKEYLILNLIEKNIDITQRKLATETNVSVALINKYLNIFKKRGLLRVKKYSSKKLRYYLSKKGYNRKDILNIWYIQSSKKLYDSSKKNISFFLRKIHSNGFRKILLYGAGEVAEILLHVLKADSNIPIEILAIIDDDKLKQDKYLKGVKVISFKKLDMFSHDGILISSYKHIALIKEKLISNNYNNKKIINNIINSKVTLWFIKHLRECMILFFH